MIVSKIIKEEKKDINQALHHAANHGQHYAATLLLDHGAEVNLKDNNGWTPLHHAAWKGHTDVATLLIDRGADVNVKTIDGRTPLELAEDAGNRKTRDILDQAEKRN